MPSFWFKKLSLSSKKDDKHASEKPSPPRLRSSWRLRRMSLKYFSFKVSILDDISFRILSAAEAVVLVLSLSCFFLCCGCHF